MTQITDVRRKNSVNKEAALDQMANEAIPCLVRILAEKHNGMIIANDTQRLIDVLVQNGVLGARYDARHIAYVKKHCMSLKPSNLQIANTIVRRALRQSEHAGYVTLRGNARKQLELVLLRLPEGAVPLRSSETAEIDIDERYPLSHNLSRQDVEAWGLKSAHD